MAERFRIVVPYEIEVSALNRFQALQMAKELAPHLAQPFTGMPNTRIIARVDNDDLPWEIHEMADDTVLRVDPGEARG